MRIGKILGNRKGTAVPLAAAVALGLLFIICGVSEYVRLTIIASGVRDAVQSAIITTVNDNYDDVYHGVREGYAGAYVPTETAWEDSVDYGEIYDYLDNLLGLRNVGTKHVKYAENRKVEYQLSDLRITVVNVPFAYGSAEGEQFQADADLWLEVPVRFGGKTLPSMKIRLKLKAGYTPRFG